MRKYPNDLRTRANKAIKLRDSTTKKKCKNKAYKFKNSESKFHGYEDAYDLG